MTNTMTPNNSTVPSNKPNAAQSDKDSTSMHGEECNVKMQSQLTEISQDLDRLAAKLKGVCDAVNAPGAATHQNSGTASTDNGAKSNINNTNAKSFEKGSGGDHRTNPTPANSPNTSARVDQSKGPGGSMKPEADKQGHKHGSGDGSACS